MLAILAAVVIVITCSRAADEPAGTTADDMVAVSRESASVGMQAIREWYANLYELFTLEMTHEPLEVDVFGDVIVHRGNAKGIMTPKARGEPIAFDNKYLFVIKKQSDGSLKVWRAIFNSNTP